MTTTNTEVTHSSMGSLTDCSWWWDHGNIRHFCGLTPGHDGHHVCSCAEVEQ